MKRIMLLISFLPLLGIQALASTWSIDTDHSNAQFKITHMVIASVRGNIPNIQGTILLDDKDITKSTVMVTLAVDSIDTNVDKRDAHLKSADFFDVDNCPVITFVSKKIEKVADGQLKVTGDLTIHAVTREVELQIEGPTESIKDPWGKTRKGVQATTRIDRKDFGLTWNKTLDNGGLLIGDEVDISIDLELILQED
jgi:polyisoprenoid-binding protein YceI